MSLTGQGADIVGNQGNDIVRGGQDNDFVHGGQDLTKCTETWGMTVWRPWHDNVFGGGECGSLAAKAAMKQREPPILSTETKEMTLSEVGRIMTSFMVVRINEVYGEGG